MAMKSWGGIHRRPGVLVRGLAGAGLVMILAVGMPARMSRAQEEGPRVELSSQPAPTGSEAPTTTPASSPAPVPGKTQKTHASLSPLGMFLGADPVVQGVMALLALASVVTWTVLLVRAVALLLAKRRLRRAITRIREAESLAAAGEAVQRGLPAQFLVAVAQEVARSAGLPSEGIKDRAQVGLGRIEAAAAKRAAAGTGILATIGSTGPFVGLFGTVWGIMHSFIGIAESHTTNLSVVAPGIAEALLATGIGLVAAIPAVVIYNALTRSVAAYRALMSDAVALILCHLSRDLDRRATGLGAPYASLSIAAE